MAQDIGLYLIAILPNQQISDEVVAIKKEFANRFDSKYALKPPPHITLKEPFRFFAHSEENLRNILRHFFQQFDYFKMDFWGFGCFPNTSSPVIFINLLQNESLKNLHREFVLFLRKVGFSAQEAKLNFHPHMTVAYRDLTPENFQLAWPEFEKRNFEATLLVEKIYLLRHNRQSWIPIEGFTLRKSYASNQTL